MSDRSNVYAGDNLRFRKAYIRERLASLKNEREALVAEREKIDEELKRSTGDGRGQEDVARL